MSVGLKLIFLGAIAAVGYYAYSQTTPSGISTRTMCKYEERVFSNSRAADSTFEFKPDTPGTRDQMFDNLMIVLRGDFHRETGLDFDTEWGRWTMEVVRNGNPC